MVQVGAVSRSFDPESYNENGFESFITLYENTYFPRVGSIELVTLSISKEVIRYFPFTWFDTSSLSSLQTGEELVNYQVYDEKQRSIDIGNSDAYELSVLFTQSRVVKNQKWSIVSLDLVFGLIGGLSAFLWALMSLIFGGYESF